MILKCMDCFEHMKSRKSKWTENIIFECMHCDIMVRTVGEEE